MVAVVQEMTLMERIRKLRLEAGLSQEDLARLVGVTTSAYRKLEKGVVTDPQLSTLLGLRRALGLDLEELAEELERERLKELKESRQK